MRKIVVNDAPINDRDLPWFVMWTVWNAMTYPGAYGMWNMVDILGSTEVLEAFAASNDNERQALLEHCLTETIRINPISSVIRNPDSAQEVTVGDKMWRLPDKGFIGVFTMGINHDPDLFESPEVFHPFRYYDKNVEKPITFGKGAFGCPAQKPTRKIITRINKRLLSEFEFSLPSGIEKKYVCVHLTYAKKNIIVGIKPITFN
ncbi:MAG: cytochrome P450 [Candidatus Magasanikbacteria bacterium]|nr:cytochrome P450 [Candidatus Magasanikbacteria bacterium]